LKKICFLSCQSLEGHIVDDTLAQAELEKDGAYQVTWIAWDDEADWSVFDLVIVRTTWDYHKRPQEFVSKLKTIATFTQVMNGPEVIEWNYHKGYLKELESRGVSIVPTLIFKAHDSIEIPVKWSEEKLVLKPAISANAYQTSIISREDLASTELAPGDWLLQPFIEEINQGEVSLHFFNKVFSHAITKTPKAGDFRVQEEHGGLITALNPSPMLLEQAQVLLSKIPFDLLYARVDMVYWKGEYALMEVELIEPALYFRTSSQSVRNFRTALDKIFIDP
jgi:glutathione synthase/RimK-type ligase-like ATP-grasp enzyme